ncbi:MAG: MFS transporter, partial [Eggerthellaceae bacterium]|nr:MFS transporter [Eggerthellaceae bacterium]
MSKPQQVTEGNGRLYVLFAIVVVGTALGGLTQTALNTMASTVLADLNTDIGWGQWLTTIYIFSMGAAVPLASFVQRKFSIRTLMLAAFGMYLVGSTCDFAAVNFPMLIIGRVLEAVASGILMPLLQTIAMTRFPENRHGTAMGIAGRALGFAPNIGPTIGGTIVVAAGWRFMFLVLMVASIALIVATFAFVRERDVREPSATLDWASLSLSTVGFGGMLLGFTAAANMPLAEPLVWLPVVLGAAASAACCRRPRTLERRGRLQLVNLRIFESQPYRASRS